MARSDAPVRINVILPGRLLTELDEIVPARKRSRFIAQALARELERVRALAAIDASAGAWSDEDHPELADGPAIDRWIAEGCRQLSRDILPDG
jgi:hypothetical protein